MVDSLLPRLERLSGLQARDSIHFARRSRDSLRAYLVRQLDRDLPPRELAGVRGVYRALGLIPDTLDLRSLLLALYTEQVMGFYDPDTKTLYVMQGVPAGALRPVLAHELVHALQDQHADLDSLIAPSRGNDRQLAAQAALEGQATLVMFRVELEDRLGRRVPVDALPDLAGEIGRAMQSQNARFPVFHGAPAIIRASVLYPYTAGSRFVQALWRRHPGAAPLDSLLPQSTEQVSHPTSRFLETRDAPTEIRLGPTTAAAGADAGGWTVMYENTLGQAELGVALQQHLGEAAARFADGWDGDRFLLLRRGRRQALLWYSVWDDAASADSFAAAYRRVAERRPDRDIRVQRVTLQGRPGVRVVDADPGGGEALPAIAVTLRGGG